MTLDRARLFVAMIDRQREIARINQAIEDTWRLFDPHHPDESNRRIGRERARLSLELATAAAEYARLLGEFYN